MKGLLANLKGFLNYGRDPFRLASKTFHYALEGLVPNVSYEY